MIVLKRRTTRHAGYRWRARPSWETRSRSLYVEVTSEVVTSVNPVQVDIVSTVPATSLLLSLDPVVVSVSPVVGATALLLTPDPALVDITAIASATGGAVSITPVLVDTTLIAPSTALLLAPDPALVDVTVVPLVPQSPPETTEGSALTVTFIPPLLFSMIQQDHHSGGA